MSDLAKVLEYYNIEFDDKIICPFHADKNPSMQIDLDKDMWYCYGCQEGGGALKFHRKMQDAIGNKDELKVSILYARILNHSVKNKSSKYIKPMEIKDASYYRNCLIEAKDYYYGLKSVDWYDDDANEECVEYMTYRGFKRSTLNRFGAKYTYKDITYPIVFPILDNGKFKGWVSRSFDYEISKTRKYLYNKGFRRRNTLAGDYRGTKVVMLVEGFMDYLKARQHGAEKVCAILGWKITDRQIEKLKSEGVTTIISALDNDSCGIKGTEYLKRYFNVIRFPYPKNVKDMGDISKKDFRKALVKIEGEITNGSY